MPYLENKRILQMFFYKNRVSKLILLMLLEKMIPLFIENHITTATSKRNNQSNAERGITQNLHYPKMILQIP